MLMSCICPVFAATVPQYNFGKSIKITGEDKIPGETYLITVKRDGAEDYSIIDTVEADANGKYTYTVYLPSSKTDVWQEGTYTVEVGNEKNEDMPKFKIKKSSSTNSSSGGGSSSGGSGSGSNGSGVVIPGTNLSGNLAGGEVILNPNQYQKYGVTAANVVVSLTKPTANTFSVGITINGQPVTNFTGYDAVMIKVPYASSSANPNSLVVYNQNGSIVPRSLFKDGYMYVRTNNISGVFTIAENVVTFNDISNATHDWAMTGVNALASRNIINGVGNGSFEPNRSVTRAEFVKMVVSMFDVNDTSASANFTDVSAGDWYNAVVGTAQKLGITNGYEDGSFRPNDTISREEMSTMLYRAAEVLSVVIESANNAGTFEDDWNIQNYAKIPVYKMRNAGILNGVGNNTFDAKSDCTRAQSAVAIYNMFIVSMR